MTLRHRLPRTDRLALEPDQPPLERHGLVVVAGGGSESYHLRFLPALPLALIGMLVLIELTAPSVVARGSEREGDLETFVAEPGTIVYADETYQCNRDLAPLIAAANATGRLLEVIIAPVKKRSIGGGRKVWNVSVKARLSDRKALVLPQMQTPAQLPEEASGDIPF